MIQGIDYDGLRTFCPLHLSSIIKSVCGGYCAEIASYSPINFFIGKWNTTSTVAPSIISILIFINIVAQVENIVDRVFPYWISICIEESKS